MATVQFGNWQIENDGVKWTDEDRGWYEFPISDFGRPGPGDRSVVIDVLVHLAEKTWIEQQDLTDLNKAAQYAMQHLGVQVDPHISWNATMQMQSTNFAMYR